MIDLVEQKLELAESQGPAIDYSLHVGVGDVTTKEMLYGMDIVVGSLFIFLFTFMIFMEDSPQAETAEGDDRREYNY